MGGWGIPDISNMNLCLLASWINRYHLSDNVIWKKIVNYKYNNHPNIFCCPEIGASPFRKGVLWACKAAQVGVRWKIGDSKTVRFWEDWWFGNCSLATQLWGLYIIANQKNLCIADLWDGAELKISFRRGVNDTLMQEWVNSAAIAESITYTDYCDAIIWSFDAGSKFSVQSMYSTVSFRGIQPVYTPVVWNLQVPPRVHIFLWLHSNNKTLTRTNLAKRKTPEDQFCLFCSEIETVHHLFFDCCVANVLRNHLSEIFEIQVGANFESVARWWVSNKKNSALNTCGAALL
jgi:hypothetical protein